MKTIAYLETDVDGNIEWSEGCLSANKEAFSCYIEIVDRKEAQDEIATLLQEVSYLQEENKKLKGRAIYDSWALNPERMGL